MCNEKEVIYKIKLWNLQFENHDYIYHIHRVTTLYGGSGLHQVFLLYSKIAKEIKLLIPDELKGTFQNMFW